MRKIILEIILNLLKLKTIKMEKYLGEKAEFSKTISESDVYLFAGITGDLNPLHVNEEFAKTTKFKKRIAHGMLSSSLICTVLGTKLPGNGTIHISQSLNFLKPVFIGDTVTVKLEVIERIIEKPYLKINCQIFNQFQDLIIDGFAVVKPPKENEV
jgi:3-hydroxybutyryl-CoA dehydratase